MSIGPVKMNGAVSNASAAVPANPANAPQPAQSAGGNGDISPEKVKQIVGEMQDHIDSMNISLQYSVYGDRGNKIAVKVVDKGTGEVIREIPPKEIQSLQAKMSELVGMIFNGKV